ncbi:aspartate aminotransferase family protein [Chloroflexota bacterium]
MNKIGHYSVSELHKMYDQFCCHCDETEMYDQFLVAENAEGLYVRFKGESEQYLDLVMGYSTLNLGHQHPRIRQANQEAVKLLDHIHSFNCESKILLSKILVEQAPSTANMRVYFPVGGAMVVDTAVKLVRAYTKKTKIVTFNGAFHGFSYGAMMLTDNAFINKEQYAPFPGEEIRLPYADCYHCNNQANCTFQCLSVAERWLSSDKDIAGLIVEPIQGAAGFIIPPKEFILGLKKLCHDNNILFIDDEIQVGMGRSGRMFAIEHFDVEPDIILLGKSLAGGYYPLSAVIARAEIMDTISAQGSALGSTFSNNPLGTYIALQVQRVLQEEHYIENTERIGAYFTEELKRFERYENIDNVTGLGLTQSIEVVKSKRTKEPGSEIAKKIQSEALKQRVIIYVGGVNHNKIKLTLPLWIRKEDVDMIIKKLQDILQSVFE